MKISTENLDQTAATLLTALAEIPTPFNGKLKAKDRRKVARAQQAQSRENRLDRGTKVRKGTKRNSSTLGGRFNMRSSQCVDSRGTLATHTIEDQLWR